MSLKVELKPGERIIIGECVVTNTGQRTRLLVDGQVPILREKDILRAEQADTPAKRLYLALQLMYTARDPRQHYDVYFSLMTDMLQAAPSTGRYFAAINNLILTGEVYKALKECKKLIAYEEELIDHAKRGAGLRSRGQQNREPARP